MRRADVVLLQLEVPLETVPAAAAAARGTVVLTPAPPQPLPADAAGAVDVLVPNEHELAAARRRAGRASAPPAELAELARSVASGGRGRHPGRPRRAASSRPTAARRCSRRRPPVDAVDTTGAGDCFCGALAQALAARRGAAPPRCGYAVTAAALSTTGPGARGALPDDDAVRALLPQVPAARPAV